MCGIAEGIITRIFAILPAVGRCCPPPHILSLDEASQGYSKIAILSLWIVLATYYILLDSLSVPRSGSTFTHDLGIFPFFVVPRDVSFSTISFHSNKSFLGATGRVLNDSNHFQCRSVVAFESLHSRERAVWRRSQPSLQRGGSSRTVDEASDDDDWFVGLWWMDGG